MRAHRWILVVAVVLAVGYVWLRGGFVGVMPSSAVAPPTMSEAVALPAESTQALEEAGAASAIFASGCFWCTESDFDKVDGVLSTTSGYTGGTTQNPTYEEVLSGRTGHAEAVLVVYDPAVVSYEALLDHYWLNVDPLVAHRQFCDVGSQYRPAIFVRDEAQRAAAEASKANLQGRFDDPILVEVTDVGAFFPAEDYHQDYYLKNSAQYRFYRFGCGRDRRLEALWGAAAGH